MPPSKSEYLHPPHNGVVQDCEMSCSTAKNKSEPLIAAESSAIDPEWCSCWSVCYMQVPEYVKRKEMEKKEEMEREKHPENTKIEIQNKKVIMR